MTSTIHQHSQGHYPKVYAAAVLLALMLLAWPTSCKKDPKPTPTPEIPTDTIVPGIPNDTISGDTITPGGDTVQYSGKTVKFIYSGGENFVPLDTIRKHLAFGDSIVLAWGVENSDYWTPVGFYGARKDLFVERFNLCPQRIGGDGLMMVYQILPDCDSTAINKKGISDGVARWYGDHGYNVYPVVTGGKSQKVIKANNRTVKKLPRNAYRPCGRSH